MVLSKRCRASPFSSYPTEKLYLKRSVREYSINIGFHAVDRQAGFN